MGIIATAAIDLWATFSSKVLRIPRTNWAMVGRWIGHFPNGTFVHHPISASPAIGNELLLGWVFHYLVGIAYAAIYFVLVFLVLGNTPGPLSAWGFGLVTIVSPWFIMQPCLGLGILAANAPQPNLVRFQNIVIHSIFGIALYFGWVAFDIYAR